MDHSKAYITFKNRILHFDDDLDLIDILKERVKREDMNSEGTTLFMDQDNSRHSSVARYTVNDQNRQIVLYHLRSTVYAAYIKDLYEEVTSYFKSVVFEAYNNASIEPGRIVGEHKITMSSVEILEMLRNGTLAKHVIDSIFQALENEKSTLGLIDKCCKKIGLTIERQLIDDAVNLLEIRHKLVHTDGYADEAFRGNHPNLSYDAEGYIQISYQTIIDMKNAVFRLIEAVDNQALENHFLHSHIE